MALLWQSSAHWERIKTKVVKKEEEGFFSPLVFEFPLEKDNIVWVQWTFQGKVSALCIFFGENRGCCCETSGGLRGKPARETKQTDEKVLRVEKIVVGFKLSG